MKFSQLFFTRLSYISILMFGLTWIWLSALSTNSESIDRISVPQTGFLAPDFTLKNISGQTITLSDLRGKVVLINVWASWCPPCREEMPAIERLYQAYKQKGLEVLAVNSTVQDSLSNAQVFVQEKKLNFHILLDEEGAVTRLYRIQSLPTSFFIGRDGVIREVVVGGPMAEALLISRVEKLLLEVR